MDRTVANASGKPQSTPSAQVDLNQVSAQILEYAQVCTEQHLQALSGTQAAGLVALVRQHNQSVWRAGNHEN